MLTTFNNKEPITTWQEDEEIDQCFFDKTKQKNPSLSLIPQVSHLTKTINYWILKERMLLVLDSYKLQKFILDTILEPDKADANHHYIWCHINDKVRSFIIKNCKDKAL